MNKSAQSPDYYHTSPIVNAVRSQLNRTQTVRKNDLYEMYQITSAMRTQLNTTIPDEFDIYNTDDTNSYATPVGLYDLIALPGYEHEIPVGTGRIKELGGVMYE